MSAEQVMTFVDNCAPVLARVLFQVRQAIKNGLDPATAVQMYLTVLAPDDVRRHGEPSDRPNANLLRERLRLTTPAEWQVIGQHYIGRNAEGNRMTEYLPPELAELDT